MWQCSQGTNMCPQAATKGVSMLHGNALAFVSGAERKLQVRSFVLHFIVCVLIFYIILLFICYSLRMVVLSLEIHFIGRFEL